MFKVMTSTDGGATYNAAKGFEVGANYVHFYTPQNQSLKFHYQKATPMELIRWCECRLNNANNTKNRVKIINAS